jgi:hypothetical protein
METQGWWVQGQTGLSAPAADFPFISNHVHLSIPFPVGEQISIPAAGGYSWPYLRQDHEDIGGAIRTTRGGDFSFGSCCPNDPLWKNKPITEVDQRHAGSIPIESSSVDNWRAFTGVREARFTADTTSKQGKRQYQSGAWNAFFHQAGAPVGITARGWYEGPGYTNVTLKDSNLGVGTGFRASVLSSTPVPAAWTINYSLAQGAAYFFAYIDPDIHHGTKGTVVLENKTGSSGVFTVDTSGLAPGTHVLIVGGWEKAAAGWNAGVLRVPFLVG